MLTTAWTQLKPHEKQSALWRESKRFPIVVAGRGSGKTELAKRRLVRFLPVRKPWENPIYAYCSPTYGQAKRIAWNSLKALIPRNWLARNGISESELSIKTVFGSTLFVVGLDKPYRIEGNQWDGIVLDECSDQRPGTFDLTLRPALTHKNGWCWRIGVPKRQGVGARDFRSVYELGLRGEDPDVISYTWPSWDILPKDEIEALRAQLDAKDFNEQIGGRWEVAGGAAFYSFSRTENVAPCTYNPNQPLVIGCDFNVDPMAWVIGHASFNPDFLQIVDELWLRNANTRYALDVLWRRYSQHKGGFIFVGDASSRSRHTSASLSDYIIIKQDERFRAKLHTPKSNPSVRDRLSNTNALLKNAAGQVRCLINPNCLNLISDLESRSLKPNGEPDDSAPDSGHITDALGYIICRLFPLTYSATINTQIINNKDTPNVSRNTTQRV